MRNRTILLCLSLPLALYSLSVSAGDLNVEVSQALLGAYVLPDDTGTQAEIEFTVTNTGGVDLYDVLIFPAGSNGVPIDPPGASIRIENLAAGETTTVIWTLDTHSEVTTENFATFGRIEAVNTATLEIEGRDYRPGGEQ